MIPLSNAWKSGAADWTTDEREGFANDLENPQLIAVTDSVRSYYLPFVFAHRQLITYK